MGQTLRPACILALNETGKKTAKPSLKKAVARITIGRTAWEKISAVEGMRLTEEAKQMFEEFDRLGLSAEERRRRIIAKHTRHTRQRIR